MGFQDYSESFISRLHIGEVRKPVAIGVAALALILIICIAVGFVGLQTDSSFEVVKADAKEEAQTAQEPVDAEPEPPQKIYVYVSGCVANEQLCELEDGARVADAVDLCGGFTEDANRSGVNLARKLTDGEQIIIPSISSVQGTVDRSSSDGTAIQNNTVTSSERSSTSNNKVNINTAQSEELQTLTGIGESKANKIIAYREANGPFKSVEDLTNVSGIGEKTLESLRDSICV